MTKTGRERLVNLLEAKYRMAGYTWTEAVASIYVLELNSYSDEAVIDVVARMVKEQRTPPDISDILAKLKTSQSADGQQYADRGFDRPGYERQRAGATPFDLMREGFESAWSERHPGEPHPDEWIRMMRQINNRKAGEEKERRERVRVAAGGIDDDEDGYDPFGED